MAVPTAEARVLCVGVGGLAAPSTQVLLRSGVRHFTLVDDDRVDESNLQRQTLFTDADVGKLKVEAAAARLQEAAVGLGATLEIEQRAQRALPDTILSLIRGHDLVLEGGDNFATKFMVADAARLARVPAAQAGVVRWGGWAFAASTDSACLRCLFEDIPRQQTDTCAQSGVVGPVVGVLGALEAALALQLLQGEAAAAGTLYHYESLSGRLHHLNVTRRGDCPLCTGTIDAMEMARYQPPECAA